MRQDQVRAWVIAKSDQNWARLAERLPDIERIALGDIWATDRDLIRVVMLIVAGDLLVRQSDAADVEQGVATP